MHSKQLINPELLNAHAYDAELVLSFATSRKYRDPSVPSRSLIISPVPQPMLYCITCTLCKKLYTGETGRRLADGFREHLRDVEKDNKNASKPAARHFNLLKVILSNIWQSVVFPYIKGAQKAAKLLNKNLVLNRHSKSLRYQRTLFIQLIFHVTSTNQWRSFISLYITHTPPTMPRFDKGLTLETLALESLYDGQFTRSTSLIKPNYFWGVHLVHSNSRIAK